jgi:hypothetical protein
MIGVAERPTRMPATVRPPMPREHGAWGILLIPFATAVGVAGVWNLPVALLLVSVLCFYLARTSYLKQNYRWTALLLAGSFASAAPLLLVWRLWWLAVLGAVAAPLAFRKTERSVVRQLLAVCGLTLTAPAASYVATGTLDMRLWLLNILYFAGGVFYVKTHVAAAIQRGGSKLRLGAATMIYYGALAVVAALWWPVGLAFVPAIVRAFIGVARLTPVLRIKRLGWTEVVHSLVFAALLIATLR